MMCAWKELLSILPVSIRSDVDRLGKEQMQELRLRHNQPPELVLNSESKWLTKVTSREELHYVINTASRYSPWSASSLSQGYLTAAGGHRIGVCGESVIKNGKQEGLREVESLCIRVARDFPGIADKVPKVIGSVLILGPPGSGKTTLLRDLIRRCSEEETVSVVDERGEVFPQGFCRGLRTDVLTGCQKAAGIQILLRTMGPKTIAVDEITEEQDCQALIQAANCGVRLLATAHGASVRDLRERSIYKPLISNGIFAFVLVLHRDRSYTVERMVR